MTPAEVRSDYRRSLDEHGEFVALRRETVEPVVLKEGLRARVTGFSPEELAAGIDQGARKIILLAEDVEASGFPLPIVKNDLVIVRGAPLSIEHVDDSTRRVAGVLIAYEIEAIGFG